MGMLDLVIKLGLVIFAAFILFLIIVIFIASVYTFLGISPSYAGAENNTQQSTLTDDDYKFIEWSLSTNKSLQKNLNNIDNAINETDLDELGSCLDKLRRDSSRSLSRIDKLVVSEELYASKEELRRALIDLERAGLHGQIEVRKYELNGINTATSYISSGREHLDNAYELLPVVE